VYDLGFWKTLDIAGEHANVGGKFGAEIAVNRIVIQANATSQKPFVHGWNIGHEPSRLAFSDAPLYPAWENEAMSVIPVGWNSARVKAGFVVCLVVLLAVFTWFIPPKAAVLHNILHHLNILPFMFAGLFFGWRGALKTILLAAVLQAPSIYRHWHHAALDAKDQVVELSTFGAAGLIAGVLADRERMQRLRVEITKHELESVYSELQQNIEQLKKTERLTAAGQLSASLAHEIRNPLASISGAAGILSRGQVSAESQRECLEILTRESQRLNKLLTNFLNFARPRLPRMQPVEAAGLLQSVASLAQHAAGTRDVRVELQEQLSDALLQVDPEQMRQLLLNLLLNAVEASPTGGIVQIRGIAFNDRYRMEVSDEGEGISPQTAQHIFEPFFTTKPTGTGLGLAIASTIASQHNGILTCAHNEDRGATFVLDLPCSSLRPAESGGSYVR